MSDTPWTPGPWKVSLPDETCVVDAEHYDVASTFQGDEDYQENYAIRSANARLIAAVPELYEALEYARDCLLGQCESDHPAVIKANAALAKASGEKVSQS